MDDVRLFAGPSGRSLPARPFRSEAELRRYAVRRGAPLLGLAILASEHPIATNGGGRIDALGLDRANSPAIVEFKRTASGTAICQLLYYLDWLESHRDRFSLLVVERLGPKAAAKIAWSSPRLICVAEEIGEREQAVARQIGRAVELVQLQRFASGIVLAQRPRASAHAGRQGPENERKRSD